MPEIQTGPVVGAEKVDKLSEAITAATAEVEQNEAKGGRDEKGRFAKAPVQTEPAPEASTEAAPAEEGTQVPEAETETVTEKLMAPGHWPKEDREAFAKLDKATQELLIKRDKGWEAQTTRKSQELSDKAKFADTVQSLFDEATRRQMALMGMDEMAAIRRLVETQRFATADPVGYIEWFAQNAGIDLGQLAPQAEGDGEAEQALLQDPSLTPIVSRIGQLEQMLQYRDFQDMQRDQSVIDRTIQSFRDAKGEDGTPQYPHFERLKKPMGALMEYHPDLQAMPDGPDKLQKAYDMALYAEPELRKEQLAQETAKAAEAQRKKDAAEKAKRAAAPKGTTPGAGSLAQKTGLDAIIAEEMEARAG